MSQNPLSVQLICLEMQNEDIILMHSFIIITPVMNRNILAVQSHTLFSSIWQDVFLSWVLLYLNTHVCTVRIRYSYWQYSWISLKALYGMMFSRCFYPKIASIYTCHLSVDSRIISPLFIKNLLVNPRQLYIKQESNCIISIKSLSMSKSRCKTVSIHNKRKIFGCKKVQTLTKLVVSI